MTVDTNNLHTLRYVRDMLGLSTSGVYYYVRSGKIPTINIDGVMMVDISRVSDKIKERIKNIENGTIF